MALLLPVALPIAACSSYDDALLPQPTRGDASLDADGSTQPFSGGTGASGGSDAATGTDASVGVADGGICGADPGAVDGHCTPCAERCNGLDDDCDDRIDEGASADCSAAHATAICSEGACLIASCDTDQRDCDGVANNGCEVSIADDPGHCGGCRRQCSLDNAASLACGDGPACEVQTCSEGYGNCDDDHANGCETLLRTPEACGVCPGEDGAPCQGLDHVASSDCATGACRVLECVPGFQDCDGSADNGCEETVGPNTCGCDDTTVDTDGDGTADCADECDNDAAKWMTGACGCGLPETDTDGDGTPDCIDLCDDVPTKTEPGQCGCDVADTDGDGDGTANCNDGCPSDPTAQGDCFPFAHSNFDSDPIDFSTQPSSVLDCGNTIVDTTDPDGSGPQVATLTNWCGTDPTPIAQAQTSGAGPTLVVIPLSGLSLASGSTLTLIGNRPVAFAARGDITLAGTVTASSAGTTPGAGGNAQCTPATSSGAGSDGRGSSSSGGGGGGGGGFGSAGGNGGDGDGNNNGVGGATRGAPNLVPLLGGCQGGRGGGCSAAGAAGGGAVQLTASGRLRVSGSLSARGGDGQIGCGSEGGGTGGGSGGGILLEADAVDLAGASLGASGGRGGNGRGGSSGASGSQSPGSPGGTAANHHSNGGGAGGGGYGRIHARGASSCSACP